MTPATQSPFLHSGGRAYVRSVPLGPTPVSNDELLDMYVQLKGEDQPFAVKGITGERQHERVVTVAPVDGCGTERNVPEAQVQAAWHSPQPLPEPRIETYKDLVLSVYPQEFADKYHTGYRFVVRATGLPHKGFKRASELASWAAELNLKLPAPAAELTESNFISIGGQYHQARHCTTLTFDAVDGIRTRALENGSVTAAQTVTDMGTGEVTLHVVGSNCTARETFDTLLWPEPDEKVVVYACPGDRHIQDVVLGWKEGVGPICQFGGKSLQEIRQEHPRAKLYMLGEAVELIQQACMTDVEEIAGEWFDHALDSLPPEGWVRTPQAESFKFMERYSGLVTTIYARVDDRFFQFRDLCTLEHEQVIERVRASGLLDTPRPEFGADDLPSPRMG